MVGSTTNAAVDPRTISNPLVAGDMGLRFYAAAPLITSDGYRLGTLNVIDQSPRDITDDEVATLQDLAAVVVDELELRLSARRVSEAKAQIERLGDALQLSVLPPPLPAIEGLDLAALYRPAGDALEIGGDFYWDGGYTGNPALAPSDRTLPVASSTAVHPRVAPDGSDHPALIVI